MIDQFNLVAMRVQLAESVEFFWVSFKFKVGESSYETKDNFMGFTNHSESWMA